VSRRVTFEAIEAQGVGALLEHLRDELIGGSYQPLRARKQETPKDGGKVRVLSIAAIRDRVVQGALKLKNRSSRRISNRDRLDIGPSGQLMA
jgi:retron-type reverse transcriptase